MMDKFGLTRYTKQTITNPAQFLKNLQQARKRGYAVSNGEGFEGILGVAAPVFHPGGSMIAALQATLHSAGLSEARRRDIISGVVATAREVTRMMSAAPYVPSRTEGMTRRDESIERRRETEHVERAREKSDTSIRAGSTRADDMRPAGCSGTIPLLTSRAVRIPPRR
jgi:hypothetical protein